ncbi:SMP-30/gluconolactonase/LRE family protein [Mycolicibacterium austroafricanum]|jgi:sugar lactone lactonase YvrE|uniref:SMP-30/gluconolactonase/LRE family protein n=1 Tax=Mycolicibacterium austroafricanum TaxID=39687 RepID=A0ABT8HK68_MYCAO|nr:SMP-30/gluconolactonase/LRE family protein [Mycolicibacterium austroafricanum]MDN4521158.1 SMP-30/gluconolactonase/LRE family protein [Mycolicibacterium austroafricanum]QRZ08228.1 SMP-30/gluconolactonase/LRE family protein [Mycolicibacterium austroafricanum]QZT69880.1 SMP-30/gluconolactonase/LRE family protein [Mycolicibacterium austroafricanum]
MKPSIDPVRWHAPPVQDLPEFGAAELTLVPVPGGEPEDVVVDAEGNLWTGALDGGIVRLRPDGSSPEVIANTGGRPLGLTFARDGRLLVCDSPRGLLAVDTTTGTVETLVHSFGGRPLIFCSNVTETADGTVYFTESTTAFTVGNYLGAILEARGRGALHRLEPHGRLTTVVDGLYFANGVTPTADGSALVFAETQGRRLSKYWLTGPDAGNVTPLAVNLPAMPDNLSTGADGRIWCAMVTPANPLADRLAAGPPLLRKLVWRLPSRVQPKPEAVVWVVAFDPDTGAAVAGMRTTHPDFSMVTGVAEAGGRLWMGSIGSPNLGWITL